MLARLRLTGNRPFTIYPAYCPAGDGGVLLLGGVPEWLKGTDCKSVGFAYAGSNPALSTNHLGLRPPV
jgi:hypothetical protein